MMQLSLLDLVMNSTCDGVNFTDLTLTNVAMLPCEIWTTEKM